MSFFGICIVGMVYDEMKIFDQSSTVFMHHKNRLHRIARQACCEIKEFQIPLVGLEQLLARD